MVRQSMGGVAAVAAPQQPTDDGFAALPDLVDVFDDGPGDLQAVEAVVAADATMVGPPCGNWRVRSGGLIGACLVVDAPLVAATVAAAAAAVAAAVAVYKRTLCLRHRLRYLRCCSINLGGG